MFGVVNQGHTRDKRLPNKKQNKMKHFMVYCLDVILICLFCYTRWGKSLSVLLTMQSLFMVIDLFNLLISIVMPFACLEKVIYRQCNVEILKIGILYGLSQVNMH